VKLIFVASDMPWKGEGWWKSREQKLKSYSEVSKLAWYWLAHGLLGLKDDPPWTVEMKHRYEKYLNKLVS
jgi:hypothetical protein